MKQIEIDPTLSCIFMMVRMFFIVRSHFLAILGRLFQPWKIIPTFKRNPDISRMIVVAIDNDGPARMNEDSAWSIKNRISQVCSLAVRA